MLDIPKRVLRSSLERILIPAFEARAFVQVPLSIYDARRRELRSYTPLGSLRRKSPEGIETVQIQLGKYGEPSFCLHFGLVPYAGIEHRVTNTISEFVAQDDVRVDWLDISYTLYQRPNSWQ